ncbi:MAG: hypothetical protein AB7F43_11800 [Bacteriovoracia bacterium]
MLKKVALITILISTTGCNIWSSLDKVSGRDEVLIEARILMDNGKCSSAITEIGNLSTSEYTNDVYRTKGWAQMCAGGAALTKIASSLLSFTSGSTNSLSVIGTLANGLIQQTSDSLGLIDGAATSFGQLSPSNDKYVNLTIAYLVKAAALMARAATLGGATSVVRADIASSGCWGLSDCTTAPVTAACDGTNMSDADAYAFGVALNNASDAINHSTGLGNLGQLASQMAALGAADDSTTGYRLNRCIIVKEILTE